MNESFESKIAKLTPYIEGETACKWSFGDEIIEIVKDQISEAQAIAEAKNKTLKPSRIKSLIRSTTRAIASEIGFSTRAVNLHRIVSMVFHKENRYENTKWEMYATSLKMPDPVTTLNLAHDQNWSIGELKAYIKRQNPKPTVSVMEQAEIESAAIIERVNQFFSQNKAPELFGLKQKLAEALIVETKAYY